MSILLPTPDAPPAQGGIARYIDALLRARNDVELMRLSPQEGTLRVFFRLFRVCRIKKNEKHVSFWTHHIFPVGTALYLLSFFFPISYTVFLHGLDFVLTQRNAWKRFLARRILRSATVVVTNSHALKQEVSAFALCKRMEVVHPCVSALFMQASESVRKGLAHRTPEELAKLFMSQMVAMTGAGISMSRQQGEVSVVRLLTVARLVERKGHEKVLRAMVDIPKATYTIVGSGPMRELLEKKAEELGIADRVTFLAKVTDEQLPELYAAHDIFVMPTTQSATDREGFGIAYAEAGLFGLPCIATRVPGVDEVVKDGETGLLIADTPDALAAALATLCAKPGVRSRLGSNARAYVLANFSEEIFAQRLRSLG